MMHTFQILAGFGVGTGIGFAFGRLQNLALRRHEQQQQGGAFTSGWSGTSGSMRRVGFLMIALVLVQLLCPVLFQGGEWWVSAGVAIGYACVLLRRLI